MKRQETQELKNPTKRCCRKRATQKHLSLESEQQKRTLYPSESLVYIDIFSDVAQHLFPSWYLDEQKDMAGLRYKFPVALDSNDIEMTPNEQLVFYLEKRSNRLVVDALIFPCSDFAPRIVFTQERPPKHFVGQRKATLKMHSDLKIEF